MTSAKEGSLMLFALALAASLAPMDEGYDACMENAVTNPDFIKCGSEMLDRRDAELNRVWKEAFADQDAKTKEVLLAEQRLWLAFRDRSCLYWGAGAFGREGQTVHFYTCRAAVIDSRIEYLNEVGDTGGGEE
jgi:uncharacterized protein YecT (DUF1311 family)